MRQPFDLSKLREAGFKRGFVDDDRRAATPHTVGCNGLNEDQLGTQRFCQDREERRLWIIAHCVGENEIEPIRDAHGRLCGFLYRFAVSDEAFAFRMRF